VLGHAWREDAVLCPECGFGRRTPPATDEDGHEVAAQTITAVIAMPATRDHEVGSTAQRSPDGHWAWDGNDWVPANLTTLPAQAVAAVSAVHAGDESAVQTLADPVADLARDEPASVPMPVSDLLPDGEPTFDDPGDLDHTGTPLPTLDDLSAMLALSEDAEVGEVEEQPLVSWALLDSGAVVAPTDTDGTCVGTTDVGTTDADGLTADGASDDVLDLPDIDRHEPTTLELLAEQLALGPLPFDETAGPVDLSETAASDESTETIEHIEHIERVDLTEAPVDPAESVEQVDLSLPDEPASEIDADGPADLLEAEADLANIEPEPDAGPDAEVDAEVAVAVEPVAAAADTDTALESHVELDGSPDLDNGPEVDDEPAETRPVGRSRQARRRQRRAAALRAAALTADHTESSALADTAVDEAADAEVGVMDTALRDPALQDPALQDPDAPNLDRAYVAGAELDLTPVDAVDDQDHRDDGTTMRRRPWESPLAAVAIVVLAAAVSTDIATGSAPLGHHTHHATAAAVADATVSQTLQHVAALETRYAGQHGVAATSSVSLTAGGYTAPAGIELRVAPAAGQGFCLVGDRAGTVAYQAWSSGQGLIEQGGSAALYGSLAAAEHACPATGAFTAL
jgi:hypothetical protein